MSSVDHSVKQLELIYKHLDSNNTLTNHRHPYTQDPDSNNDDVLLLLRLMDNDPALEQETTNITVPINRTNLTNNNNNIKRN